MDFSRLGGDDLSLNFRDYTPEIPVGAELIELPDGSEALLLGDIDTGKDYFHTQGENDYGFDGTCGLTSCGDVINQYGIEVTENDIVRHAVENGECAMVPDRPEMCGGTTVFDQARILTDFGVPAHIEIGNSMEGLAEKLDQGHAAIIEVNAGELWDDAAYYDAGQPNHAVTLRAVLKDPETGVVIGVVINDSGRGDFGRILPADHAALKNWMANGGMAVVTDLARS